MNEDWRVTLGLILALAALVAWVLVWVWSYRLFATQPLHATLRVTIPTLALLAANLYIPTFTIEGVMTSDDAGASGRLSNEVSLNTLIVVAWAHVLPAVIALIRVPPKED